MALRLRRGTEAERIITPEQGELLYVTDTKKVYVGDGATPGGILVGPVDSSVLADTTPQLGGNLDLNGSNIIGTGNINITGNITATGTINLGDGAEDNINVGGLINSSLTPAIDDSYNLGTSAKQWANVWSTQVNVDTTLAVGSQIIKLSSGSADSNLVLWDAETDTISASVVLASTFEGNLVGSVFSDDSSTVLVDGINSVLSNGRLTLRGDVIEGAVSGDISLDSQRILTRSYGITNSPDDMGYVSIQSFRGTKTDLLTVESGDLLGSFTIGGYDSGPGEIVNKVLITGAVDSVTGTNSLPGKILFTLEDYNGNYSTYASLNSRGVFENSIFKATPFANSNARDTAIPNPEAGMVIFNRNDDSTGRPQLQCYDGTAWVELH